MSGASFLVRFSWKESKWLQSGAPWVRVLAPLQLALGCASLHLGLHWVGIIITASIQSCNRKWNALKLLSPVWASLVDQWQRIHLPMQEAQETYLGLVPGLGRSPGGGNGNPLQYSCLGNPMDRGVWQATVHGVTKIPTQLSTYHTTST